MITDDVLDGLQRSACVAGSTPGGWNTFLGQLTEAFGASSACLRSSRQQDPGSVWIAFALHASVRDAYVFRWAMHDPWASHPRGHAMSRAGRCLIGSHLVPPRELRRTAFHADFARHVGLTHVMSAMVEDGSAGPPPTKLSLFREDTREDFTNEQLRAFETLQPTLRCGLHSHWLLANTGAGKAAIECTLNALPSAVLVLSATGRVLFANSRARELPAGSVRLVSGALHGVGQIEAGELSASLRMTLAGAPQSLPFWLSDKDEVQTGNLLLSLLASDDFSYFRVWPSAKILAEIRLDSRDTARRARIRALVQKHCLTSAEERVVRALARGLTPEEAAGELHVSMNTMRTHLRHVIQKVRGRRIGDVLNLL